MLCDVCQKHLANLFVTKIVNSDVTKMKLCSSCAQEMQIDPSLEDDAGFEQLINELLPFANSLMASEKAEAPAAKVEDPDLSRCSTCGMSYRLFKMKGRLGCEDCYLAFEDRLMTVIDEVQKSRAHQGKVALSAHGEVRRLNQIASLKESIKEAVQNERYEDAAKLRDEIERLEGEGYQRRELSLSSAAFPGGN